MKQYVKTLESSQQELVRKTLGKNRAHLADLPQDWPSVAQFGLHLNHLHSGRPPRYITLLPAVRYQVGCVEWGKEGKYVFPCEGRPGRTGITENAIQPVQERLAGPRLLAHRIFKSLSRGAWKANGYDEPAAGPVQAFPGSSKFPYCQVAV